MDLFWDNPGRSTVTARFGVRNVAVTVLFEQAEEKPLWRVSFTVECGEIIEVITAAFEVFNGIMQALEEFLDIRQPEVVVLVSKTEQLTHIYEVHLRREAERVTRLGYRLERPVKAEPFTEFTLRRTRTSEWRE